MKKLILLSILLIVGCEGVFTPEDDTLVGIWEATKIQHIYTLSDGITEDSYDIDYNNMRFTLKADSTFTEFWETNSNTWTENGYWSASDSILTITYSEDDYYNYNYWLNGDSLTLLLDFNLIYQSTPGKFEYILKRK